MRACTHRRRSVRAWSPGFGTVLLSAATSSRSVPVARSWSARRSNWRATTRRRWVSTSSTSPPCPSRNRSHRTPTRPASPAVLTPATPLVCDCIHDRAPRTPSCSRGYLLRRSPVTGPAWSIRSWSPRSWTARRCGPASSAYGMPVTAVRCWGASTCRSSGICRSKSPFGWSPGGMASTGARAGLGPPSSTKSARSTPWRPPCTSRCQNCPPCDQPAWRSVRGGCVPAMSVAARSAAPRTPCPSASRGSHHRRSVGGGPLHQHAFTVGPALVGPPVDDLQPAVVAMLEPCTSAADDLLGVVTVLRGVDEPVAQQVAGQDAAGLAVEQMVRLVATDHSPAFLEEAHEQTGDDGPFDRLLEFEAQTVEVVARDAATVTSGFPVAACQRIAPLGGRSRAIASRVGLAVAGLHPEARRVEGPLHGDVVLVSAPRQADEIGVRGEVMVGELAQDLATGSSSSCLGGDTQLDIGITPIEAVHQGEARRRPVDDDRPAEPVRARPLAGFEFPTEPGLDEAH